MAERELEALNGAGPEESASHPLTRPTYRLRNINPRTLKNQRDAAPRTPHAPLYAGGGVGEPSESVSHPSYQGDQIYPPACDYREVFQRPFLVNSAVSQGRGLERFDECKCGLAANRDRVGADRCQKETRGIYHKSDLEDFALQDTRDHLGSILTIIVR